MSNLNARASHSHVTLKHLNAHKQVHKRVLKHIHASAFSSTHVMLASKLHVTHTCTACTDNLLVSGTALCGLSVWCLHDHRISQWQKLSGKKNFLLHLLPLPCAWRHAVLSYL